MSIKDCLQLAKGLDPEDSAAITAQQKDLVASGVPGNEAWTQAAELVMDNVLAERNALAAEIAAKGGFLQVLDIENLLNPQSYPQPDTGAPQPDAGVSEPKGKYHKGQRRKVRLQDEVPGLKSVWRHLTEAERKKLNRASAKKLVDMFAKMPEASEMASVAFAGRAKRGWYQNSARAILDIFGVEDAPRFAALMAALSPQTSVEQNAINALKIWSAWTSHGGINRNRDRPTDPDVILDIMAKNVPGTGTLKSVLGAWRNNSIRALTAEFPENLIISGPKVNSFMMNLRGEVNEVTNDTWMANYALLTEGRPFEGELNPKETDPGKGSGYLAMSATVRQAAKIISQRTGETWTPAEVQETVWSWAKAAYEKRHAAGENRTVVQLLEDADLLHEDVADVPDFERLFVQGAYAEILGKPYADVIEEIKRAQASGTERYRRHGVKGDATSAEGAGIAAESFQTHLRQAARRLEKLRGIRLSQKVGTDIEEGGAEYEIPTEPRETERTVREDENPQGDLFAAADLPSEEARAQSADTFHVLYESTEVGTIQSGVTRITSHDDAAHLFASIRKHAQETFMIAITDDDGNILNLVRNSIGTRDGASVYPLDVVGAIAATEGGTKYWLAHNHPSGVREASMADKRITETIHRATDGLDVQYQGHVIIGDTGYSDAMNQEDKPIPAYARRKKVSITERKLKKKKNQNERVVTSPADAKAAIADLDTQTGLLMMDNRNRVVGVVALTTQEMKKLRDGVQVRRILAAIDKTNANALIPFNKEPEGEFAVDNMAGFLGRLAKNASIRTIDAIWVDPTSGELVTSSEQGLGVGELEKPFAMRRGANKMKQANHRRKVTNWLKKPLRRLSRRLPVVIVNNEMDVDFDVPPKAAGVKYNGKIYLFKDYIRDEREAIEAVEHEAIGHLGIEGVLGKRKFDELVGDVSNIMVEILMDSSGKLHPKVRAIQAELRKYYTDESGNFNLSPREEAREIIAHIAHSKPRLGRLREIYNKIAAWVGEWAAKVGLADPDVAMIESLLVRATDYITDHDMQLPVDNEKAAAMRRQGPDTESQEDKELADALGLGGKERKSFIKRMRALTSEGLKTALRTASNRTEEGLFDGLIEMQRKEIEANVGWGKEITYMAPDKNGNATIQKKTFDYENSAYVAARLATGISDMMTYLLNYGGLQWDSGIVKGVEGTRGFKDIMKELGVDNLKPWLIWMGGNRANQLMAEGRERNLSQAQIDLAMSKNQGKEELFNKIKDEYNKLNQLQLDFAQEAGLIDADKRAEWDSEWYVPFYRQSDEDRTLGPNTKRGLSHQSAGIRRLMGSDVPTADLFENIMANWIKLTDASVKNHALRLMIDNFKDTEYISDKTADFKKAMVPKTELHKFIKENREFAHRLADWLNLDRQTTTDGIWDAVSELDPAGLEKLWQVVAPTAPDIVRVQRNGKNEYHQIHTPGLLRAVNHMTPREWQSSGGMRAARWFKTLLTTGVTASPDFMIRNFIRDAAHSWAINKDNMFFLKDSYQGLMSKEYGSLHGGAIHKAMMAGGASFQGGYVHGTNPDATAEIMRRELIKAGWKDGAITSFLDSIVDTPGKLSRVTGLVWQEYRDAGDRVENASRVATAEAGRKAGKPMAQWLFESKDLMDYSRRGNAGALIFLTDVMPFLNARIQGAQKLYRATKEDPMIVGRKLAMIAGFSIFLAMLNDDDDDYQELPDWEKDAYWHVFPHFNGKKQHIRIPKPFEIGFFAGTMPERMWRAWVTETQPSDKVKWAFMHGIKETMNINIYPQIILPIAELKANRHFYFDQPIETEHERKNVLPKERYNQYTSETAIMLASGLDNPLTDWLEMSPKQLQHLWNGYTGTMGSYLLSGVDLLAANPLGGFPKPEEIQLEDMPAIKSLYKGQRKRTTQWQIDVYDRIQEVNQIYGTLKKYREEAVESGDKTKYTEFKAKHYDKLKARKTLVRAQKNFSKLRKLRERILKDDSLTGAQKYQQSQAIQVRINALAKKIEGATREGF